MRWAPLLLLLYVCAVPAQIYRWVDEEGNVSYGDFPPADSRAREVHPDTWTVPGFVAPESPAPALEPQGQLSAPAESAAPPAPHCFDAAAALLGGATADPDRPLVTRQLSAEEHRDLEQWLRQLRGIWEGRAEKVVCRGKEAAPRRDAEPYRMELRLEQDLDGKWWFKARQDGLETPRRELRRFWFLLQKDALTFGLAEAVDPTAERWAIQLLAAGPEEVAFVRKFRRRAGAGGVVRVLELRRIRVTRRTLQFGEYLYSQGVLTDWETWTLTR